MRRDSEGWGGLGGWVGPKHVLGNVGEGVGELLHGGVEDGAVFHEAGRRVVACGGHGDFRVLLFFSAS